MQYSWKETLDETFLHDTNIRGARRGTWSPHPVMKGTESRSGQMSDPGRRSQFQAGDPFMLDLPLRTAGDLSGEGVFQIC